MSGLVYIAMRLYSGDCWFESQSLPSLKNEVDDDDDINENSLKVGI